MENGFMYAFDKKNDVWVCYYDDNYLFSISREKVCEEKDGFNNSLVSEFQAFKGMCAEIIMERIGECDNHFMCSAFMGYLFD